MSSIRSRLSVAYAVALGATVSVFAAALWLVQGEGATADLHRLVRAQAEVATRILRQAADDGAPMLVPVASDTTGALELRRDVGSRLTPLPDYMVVLDRRGQVVYNSPDAKALGTVPADRLRGLSEDEAYAIENAAYGLFDTFVRTGRQLTDQEPWRRVRIGDQQVLVGARTVRDPSMDIERVIVGMPTDWMVERAQRELLGTILVIAPLLILLSVGVAYYLAGRAFEPMERLTNDLEAITDGRSLHRRLTEEGGGDEIARLAVTLNAMLGRLENYFGALRRFTADASHELKTPLAVLRADVERAMSASTPPSERLEALEEALHETTRMADLVDQLLTLARADEGRFDLHREPVELAPLVQDVYETALILGEAAGLHVEMPVCEEVTIMGDRTRLRQLFLNLATNAIKYTPRGGEVQLALRRAGDVATLSVRDTGIGIAAADLPYIFDRFWRADRVRSRSGERAGFGLGLAISQWIAQAHGGALTAASRLTRGSVFTVTLPVAPTTTAEYAIPTLRQREPSRVA